MPLQTAQKLIYFGLGFGLVTPNTYCQSNTTEPNYGKCYNIGTNKAIFVQTDISTYPSLPCETDNTCTRYTNVAWDRYIDSIFYYPNKQAIVQYIFSRSHSNLGISGRIISIRGHPFPSPGLSAEYSFLFPAHHYELTSWPIYDTISNWFAHLNPYSISLGRVFILRWQGAIFTSSLYISAHEGGLNNIWYAADLNVVWAYESSPLAVIPLDYDRDYMPYQELRNAFGYAATGVDQPGWNADDMIRVLRELFPNRAWAVFDDRQYVLYLYNLTPDYVPDWLIEKLTPTAMKVLQPPADAAVAKAWLDLLNERNAQIPPQAELP